MNTIMLRIKNEYPELVNEILDQIPPWIWVSTTTTFLDPEIGGGQFVREIERRLRAAGHSDENIKKRVFGLTTNALVLPYVKNKYGLAGTYEHTNFLTWEPNMEFDAIVGNPPYQSDKGNGSHPIYKKFVEKSLYLTKKGGFVAMIVPPGVVSGGNLTKPTKLFQQIKEGNLVKFQHFSVGDHFPGIGSLFCYFVWQSASYSTKTEINGNVFNIEDFSLIYPALNAKSYSIISKITFTNKINTTYRKESNPLKFRVGFKELNHISNSRGNIKPILFAPGEKADVSYIREVSSKEEAQFLVKYLESNIASFFNYIVRHNNVIHNGIISNLSVPPLTKTWTDEELYAHFDLTPEEIEYIEANVT